ncbi:hypothetical protein QBC37DRAFT_122292, partial [Rhypophila decipiens]
TAFIDHGKPPTTDAPESDSEPATPEERSPEPDSRLFFTPKKSLDVRKQLNTIVRDLRTVATKAGKALDEKNIENAALKHKISHLQAELESQKPYSKKRVKVSGPEKLATMEAIIEAQKASELPPRRRRAPQPTIEPNLIEEAREQIEHGLRQLHEQIDE